MEKWNELCFILSKSISSDVAEKFLELKVIQAFEKLGWSHFRKEISVQEKIRVATTTITPDIIIKSNETKLFVIDVKRPSEDLSNPSYQKQLSDYIRMLHLDFGMLIGNEIRIIVDGSLIGSNESELLEIISFVEDNPKGLNFIKLFQKETFSFENIEKYIENKIEVIKENRAIEGLINEIETTKYSEFLKVKLKAKLLTEHNESVVDKVLESLDIKIQNKNKIESLVDYDKRSTRRFKTIENFNEPKGKLPIGKYVRKTFNELVKNKLIDNIEIGRLQRPDYSKSTFDIQFPFLAKENSKYYERVRYWKNPYYINGEMYFVTSQWYEVPANNDRPYYEEWLRKMNKNDTNQ